MAGRRDRLIALAHASPPFMAALHVVERLGLARWCIGAGAVRNLVWDHLHGFDTPTPLADVDVVFFDDADLSAARERACLAALLAAMPGVPWEVINQARVHTWFEGCFGYPMAPLPSLEAGVASWPEYATCVGLTLGGGGSVQVIAPHGLDDLFDMVVRHNPARASVETYRQRVAAKRHAVHWPRVRVIPA